MVEEVNAFPLHWPLGYIRTKERTKSKFGRTPDQAQRELHYEIGRIGGSKLIISSNLRVRTDGYYYATDLLKKIDDPGVAIYFKRKGSDIVMCCDKYHTVFENIDALSRGLKALRDMDRWGVSDFIERSFAGFKALPPPSVKEWWEVLAFRSKPESFDAVKSAYKLLAIQFHPDAGAHGSHEMMTEINAAYNKAKKYFGQ